MNKRYNLCDFRKRKNLNQTEIAELLGISRPHYSDIENGKADPSFGVMEKFEEVFKNQYQDIWILFKKGD